VDEFGVVCSIKVMNLHIHFVQIFVVMLDVELPPKIIPQVTMEEM
jgi:hypothetical protein